MLNHAKVTQKLYCYHDRQHDFDPWPMDFDTSFRWRKHLFLEAKIAQFRPHISE